MQNEEILQFNKRFKVGDPVDFKNNNGTTERAFLRWPAEQLENGKPVIWVTGKYDCINFENVNKEPIKLLSK